MTDNPFPEGRHEQGWKGREPFFSADIPFDPPHVPKPPKQTPILSPSSLPSAGEGHLNLILLLVETGRLTAHLLNRLKAMTGQQAIEREMESAADSIHGIRANLDTLRVGILALIHEAESLNRENDAVVDLVIDRLQCSGVAFHKDGTVSLHYDTDPEEYDDDDDDDDAILDL